jgi:hypothetical protein
MEPTTRGRDRFVNMSPPKDLGGHLGAVRDWKPCYLHASVPDDHENPAGDADRLKAAEQGVLPSFLATPPRNEAWQRKKTAS